MAVANRTSHATVFFVDIVGLSDPAIYYDQQIKKISQLNKIISRSCYHKKSNRVLPTGDGMAIVYEKCPQEALDMAIDLHKELAKYNKEKEELEMIKVRVGIGTGTVFFVKDITKASNFWGEAVIMARRVMDLGNDGHILLTSQATKAFQTVSDTYSGIIHPLKQYSFKHGVSDFVYSVYGPEFGNKKEPRQKNLTRLYYPTLREELSFGSSPLHVRHTRQFEIVNESGETRFGMKHILQCDGQTTLAQLGLVIKDKSGNKLALKEISHQNNTVEFVTRFAKPIADGEKDQFTMAYTIKRKNRRYEQEFPCDCQKMTLVLRSNGLELKPRGIMSRGHTETNLTSKSRSGLTSFIVDDVGARSICRVEW